MENPFLIHLIKPKEMHTYHLFLKMLSLVDKKLYTPVDCNNSMIFFVFREELGKITKEMLDVEKITEQMPDVRSMTSLKSVFQMNCDLEEIRFLFEKMNALLIHKRTLICLKMKRN